MSLLHRQCRSINQGRSLDNRALQGPGLRNRRPASMPPHRPTPVARSSGSAMRSDCSNRSLRNPPGRPGDSRRVAPGVPGKSPSGRPNDQPPGARVRRTSFQVLRFPLPGSSALLPKCFASSATKLARKLPPAWSPFPVTDGFVVAPRTVRKRVSQVFSRSFAMHRCVHRSDLVVPRNRRNAPRRPPAYAQHLWRVRAPISASRRRRPLAWTARRPPRPRRWRRVWSRRRSSEPRPRGEGPGRRPPSPWEARRRRRP